MMGKDKLVLSAKFAGDHYTLDAGHYSSVIDFHRTPQDEHGRHATVFAIQHERLLSPMRVSLMH